MVWFFVIITIPLVGAAVFYWRWRRVIDAEVAEGAAFEWAHLQKHEPEFLAGISEEKFREIYALVHTPRFPGYVLAMTVTFFASLPVTLGFLVGALWVAQQAGIVPEPVEVVRYVRFGEIEQLQPWECGIMCQLDIVEAYSGFYYFFGVLAAWLGIVAFFMRRFHRHRPGYLRDEIIRTRE